MSAVKVPDQLAERFLPQEAPAFEVIDQRGNTRLWKSTTVQCEVQGQPRAARTHFHITVGDRTDIVLMPRFDLARLNFEAASSVVRNEVGEWTDNGEVVRCSLGWHDGAARAHAEARVLGEHMKPMTEAEKVRFIEYFNTNQ